MSKYILYIVFLSFVFGCSTNRKDVDSRINEKTSFNDDSEKNTVRYYLAHRLLPELFFSNPEEVIDKINQQGHVYFESILSKFHTVEQKDTYNPSDLNITRVDKNGESYLLIRFPRPDTPLDAYYIALSMVNEKPRYFILEKLTPDLNNRPDEAAFCEWDKSGKHLNYGIVMVGIPTKDDFMHVINAAINGKLHPVIKYEKAG